MERTGMNSDHMLVTIEEIIRVQRSDSDAFMKIQKRRLQQLRRMQKEMLAGKTECRSMIIKDLQESGILDSDGELSKHYRDW